MNIIKTKEELEMVLSRVANGEVVTFSIDGDTITINGLVVTIDYGLIGDSVEFNTLGELKDALYESYYYELLK